MLAEFFSSDRSLIITNLIALAHTRTDFSERISDYPELSLSP
jgi:hypothetical protein